MLPSSDLPIRTDNIDQCIKWWQEILNLQQWVVKSIIVDQTSNPQALMEIVPTRTRTRALIRIKKSTLKVGQKEFQTYLVHELCHLLYDPLVEEYDLAAEFSTDQEHKEENSKRFVRILEKCVEQTAQMICKATLVSVDWAEHQPIVKQNGSFRMH